MTYILGGKAPLTLNIIKKKRKNYIKTEGT